MSRVHSADVVGSIPTEFVERLEVAEAGNGHLDEAVRLLRRWRKVGYPTGALDDETDAFLSKLTESTT